MTINTTNRSPAPDSLELLWEIANGSRRIHETMLNNALGSAETAGSCLFASVHLAMAVNKFSGWHARVKGGHFNAPDGRVHGHYWVQAWLNEASFILDITADQFGAATVQLLPESVAQNYVADDDATIDRHLRLADLPTQ